MLHLKSLIKLRTCAYRIGIFILFRHGLAFTSSVKTDIITWCLFVAFTHTAVTVGLHIYLRTVVHYLRRCHVTRLAIHKFLTNSTTILVADPGFDSLFPCTYAHYIFLRSQRGITAYFCPSVINKEDSLQSGIPFL